MFWEWFWDLYELTFGTTQPCPNCHLWPCADCGYLEKDLHAGDCDCIAPDSDDLNDCDGCHHLICNDCKITAALIGVDMATGKDKTCYRYSIGPFIFFTDEPLTDAELEAIKKDPEGAISLLKEAGFVKVQL